MLKHFIGALFVVMLFAFATSCGGGGSTAQPGPGGGDNPPGLMGNIDAPPAAGDFPQPQMINGAWPDAPLGTNPEYDVQPAAGATVGHQASAKAGSSLEPGQLFQMLGATMALSSVAEDDLDWDAQDLSFTEGTKVSFWLRYEAAPDCKFVRRWRIAETGLDFPESITEVPGGIYTVRFDYSLPFVDGDQSVAAVFEGSLFMQQASAVIVVDPGLSSGSVPFVITKVPTDPFQYSVEEAQMGWEDLIIDSDYDYNDFVTRMRVTELRRRTDNKLVQINMWVKAVARGAGYDGSWQFNMDGAFPGSTAVAYIDQYYANGTPHGAQRIWTSRNGASIPVFSSNKVALPQPPESFATNTVINSKFMNGDYAEVTILFDTPLSVGTYTPMPYKPQLRVFANNGSVYVISLWTRRGDPVDANGRPLAFIIPDSYAWPLEGRRIWYGYPRFNDWVYWVNHSGMGDNLEPKFWDDTPVWKSGTIFNVYQSSLFK